MSSIYGTETFAIDAKGRVNIPARMRRGIHPDAMDTFLMLQGFEGCVSLYPLDEWRKREEELRKLPQTDSQTRLFQRRLLEHAQETTLDAQGRLTLSPALLALAGLRKEARIVGLGNHIEVWDPKRYQANLGSDQRTLEDLAKDLNW